MAVPTREVQPLSADAARVLRFIGAYGTTLRERIHVRVDEMEVYFGLLRQPVTKEKLAIGVTELKERKFVSGNSDTVYLEGKGAAALNALRDNDRH